jgi:crotonobetainyl-CoA:carnitine CoA-transferase CaiB-like acyl-CoA transferase
MSATDTQPLSDLIVIDLSTTLPGATATQFLADAGARVILVEPPGGSPLRGRPDWPVLARGKESVVLDLGVDVDRARLDAMVRAADVLVTTMRPATSKRHELTPEWSAGLSPRLVHASITGWGACGPWADIKGYEALVMAKLGYLHCKARLSTRPGPSYVSVPFASWGAGQTAVHGILAALIEREASGTGQHVAADLVRGLNTIDTWQWFTDLIGARWPDAYVVVEAYDDEGRVQAPLVYPLLAAPTKDGHWLQFAQVEPRLFAAMMTEFGLSHLFTDPRWAGIPVLDSQELRTELWELMIAKVGERTLAEWQDVFDTNPNINAEVFRSGSGVFDHPQLRHDRRTSICDDPDLGPVRQPSTLVHTAGHPLSAPKPAPRIDAHRDLPTASSASGPTASAPSTPPLAGLTVLDLGMMYAGPFGATLLTELGARVIKIETTAGDSIRRILSFPESGAAKVMQGKQSICVDLTTTEGREIIHRLAKSADVVLQCFRAGAAERVGVGRDDLRAVNPELIWVNAPGYGTDGPCGHRPAYAPSIGAAAGLALTDAPDAVHPTDDIDDIKRSAARLATANAIPQMQADGIAALGVASTILLGILARARSRPLPELTATMIGTATHALAERLVSYPNRPSSPEVDRDGYGVAATYRIYPAATGYVFLAAPSDRDWADLVSAVGGDFAAIRDDRFATAAGRRDHDAALAGMLSQLFATTPARRWEELLTRVGVGCVEVHEGSPQTLLQTHKDAVEEYAVTVESPLFDEHLRMGPTVLLSRSATTINGFCLAGQHTEAILRELGYDDKTIADLRHRSVVA